MSATTIQSNGLITTGDATCAGYIFNFSGHGGFDPSGKVKVGDLELTQAQIDAHNAVIGEAEVAALKKVGKGVLYLNLRGNDATRAEVSTWAGHGKFAAYGLRTSYHNMAGPKGRTDVWFDFDGSQWHGVNIGNNDICRVKRCKS